MAEKSNEELLREFVTATMNMASELRMDGDEARYEKARAAVLARMAGPGEVVVPVEIDRALPEWQASDSSQSYWAKCLAVLRGPG